MITNKNNLIKKKKSPPLAQKRPFRIGRFQVFCSVFSGTPSFARFGDKFFLFTELFTSRVFIDKGAIYFLFII